jgi:hypothetical protein
MGTKKLGQRTEIHPRHDKKIATLEEEAVGHQGMEVGMPSRVISERLNGHDDSRNTGFLTKGELEEFRQTFYSTLAELAQKFAVIEKESSQDFGDGEDILPVGYRIKNRFLEMVAELDQLLGMAGGAKPSSSTGKRQNVLMMAIRAFYPREAFAEISAFKIFSYYMGNYRTVETVLLLEKIVIALLELKKVVIEQLPQGTLPRFSFPVYRNIAAAFHASPPLPSKREA